MKRLFIIVEGQTEQEFVNGIIAPYFGGLGFHDIKPLLIKTSKTGKGGFVNYAHLKNDVLRLLKQEKNIIVSTFFDYFRMPTNIPSYDECITKQQNTSPFEKVSCIEKAIDLDINDKRFVPYVQLHEFEAVLFSSNKGFMYYYEESISNKTQIIINEYPNPELINNSPKTAPSKRLIKILPSYEKIVDGNLIALEIGINIIMKKCLRFNNWIKLLEKKLKE